MDTIPEQHRFQARIRLRRRMQQYAVLFLSIILTATAAILQSLETRELYHTSILTGEGWVLELLAGHPDQIHCELGVSYEVFAALISSLWEEGHGNSKHVSLEELHLSVDSSDCNLANQAG